jgi:hypothetical protein
VTCFLFCINNGQWPRHSHLYCFTQVTADYKSAVFTPDVKEQRKMQSDMLSAVFETYFRILKHVMQSTAARLILWHKIAFKCGIGLLYDIITYTDYFFLSFSFFLFNLQLKRLTSATHLNDGYGIVSYTIFST